MTMGKNQTIEPSLKDKLLRDQVRLNELKGKNIMQDETLPIDDIDVLNKEIGEPKLYENLKIM